MPGTFRPGQSLWPAASTVAECDVGSTKLQARLQASSSNCWPCLVCEQRQRQFSMAGHDRGPSPQKIHLRAAGNETLFSVNLIVKIVSRSLFLPAPALNNMFLSVVGSF